MRIAVTTLLLGLLVATYGEPSACAQDPGARPMGGAPPHTHVDPPQATSGSTTGSRSSSAPLANRRRYSHSDSPAVRVGVAAFSATWSLATIAGGGMIRADSTSASCPDCRRNGLLLCVPLIGPGVTLILDDTRGTRVLFGIVGGLQLASLVVVGIALIPRRDRGPTRHYGSDVYVGASFDRLVLRIDF